MKQVINRLSVNTFGDSQKQSIIFVHGFPYDHTMWNSQIEALKENYYCVAYDVRGLGESPVGNRHFTMESFVDDLFYVIDELKLNKPVLCGLSMGGYIALRALDRNQDKFSSVILCDTRTHADDNTGKLKRSENIRIVNTEGHDKFVIPFVTNCFSEDAPKDQKELLDSTLTKCLKQNPAGVQSANFAIMSRIDTTHVLPNIKIPTLVLVGSFDRLTPTTVMRDMADQIPGSEFGIIPRAGHMTPIENPGAVNDLILGFLRRRIKG